MSRRGTLRVYELLKIDYESAAQTFYVRVNASDSSAPASAEATTEIKVPKPGREAAEFYAQLKKDLIDKAKSGTMLSTQKQMRRAKPEVSGRWGEGIKIIPNSNEAARYLRAIQERAPFLAEEAWTRLRWALEAVDWDLDKLDDMIEAVEDSFENSWADLQKLLSEKNPQPPGPGFSRAEMRQKVLWDPKIAHMLEDNTVPFLPIEFGDEGHLFQDCFERVSSILNTRNFLARKGNSALQLL